MKPNELYKIPNLFSPQEVDHISSLIDSPADRSNFYQHEDLGRLNMEIFNVSPQLDANLTNLINELTGRTLTMASPLIVEYSNKYGSPHLPPHFDGDSNEVIIDYQLSSNTRWPIGLNISAHDLEDNSALIFNPNTNVHWRPHKTFNDGEYVRMMFFRFFDEKSPADYSYLPHHPEDPIFKEARECRDSFSLD